MKTQLPAPIASRLEFAINATRQAGDQTLELFRSYDLDVDHKNDGSPVTAADRSAEQLLRAQIAHQFPDDAILGEEFGETTGESGYRWVLDPIDGTKSFVSGVPLYSTLVAVLHNGEPIIGVLYVPAMGEMVYAASGGGCWHVVGSQPPRQTTVSQVDRLDESVFVTTCIRSYTTDRAMDGRPVYDRLETLCRVTRTWGDAFGYLLVATGRAEIMIDPILNLWDAACLQPIIEEAGGRFFDWQGHASVHSNEAIATNAALADDVLEIIRELSGTATAQAKK